MTNPRQSPKPSPRPPRHRPPSNPVARMTKHLGAQTRGVSTLIQASGQTINQAIEARICEEELTMKKALIPAVLMGALISTSAFAHRGWGDDEGYRPYRGHYEIAYPPAPIVVYQQPQVVYAPPPPPRVIYLEQVVFPDAPPYSYRSAPTYYQQQPTYRATSYYDGNRIAGQVIGAVAGGVIGNQIGRGGGRVVSTAAGAVLGAIAGDRLSY